MDEELLKIIKGNLEKYPLMQAQDIYKLVYQHEFGCAHAVGDREWARARLLEEYRAVKQISGPLLEDIGNGYARLRLDALDANGVTPEEALDLFIRSAEPAGDKAEFARMLGELPACGLPFDPEELKAFFEAREEEGFPAVHHSEQYREAYKPAYRVVKKTYSK